MECWDSIWNRTSAGALSNQRVEKFMIMQQSPIHQRPQTGAHNRWEWIGAHFSLRGSYKKLCEGQYEESLPINRAFNFIWRQKVPLKVRFFGWLLLRRKLMTQVFHGRLYLETSVECTLCLIVRTIVHIFFSSAPLPGQYGTDKPFHRQTTSETSF